MQMKNSQTPNLIQYYRCVITSVEDSSFWALMVDKTNHLNYDYEAEFSLSLIKDAKPGIVFDWYLFDNGSQSIQPHTYRLTRDVMERAKVDAKEFLKAFGGE
jgi:hypothetical protein